MPIYEYRCERCRSQFELLVSSSEGKGIRCPDCNTSKVKKAFSMFAVTGGSRSRESEPSCGGCRSRRCSTCRG